MRRLTAIALMAALSSGAFAQEALWGKAPVVSPEIHADGTVTFRIEAAKAGKVQLTGDFLPVKQVDTPNGTFTVSLRPK